MSCCSVSASQGHSFCLQCGTVLDERTIVQPRKSNKSFYLGMVAICTVVFSLVLGVDYAIQRRRQSQLPIPIPTPVYVALPAPSVAPTQKPKAQIQSQVKPTPEPEPKPKPKSKPTPDEIDRMLDELLPVRPASPREAEMEQVGREAKAAAYGRKRKKP